MKLPVGVSGLIGVLQAHGWVYEVTHGSGTVEAQAFGPPRGDGTRPKITIDAPCESIAVRARHERTGRQIRALYVCRTDKPKRAWTMTTAWRGRHVDDPTDHTPRPLTATEVKAYVAATAEALGDAA